MQYQALCSGDGRFVGPSGNEGEIFITNYNWKKYEGTVSNCTVCKWQRDHFGTTTSDVYEAAKVKNMKYKSSL